MSLTEKVAFFLVIGAYIVVQLFTIATEYSGPRTILIKKENNKLRIDSITRDSIITKGLDVRSYEAFHVKVKAKTFWNKLLLTNEDGNLLCEIFKIATSLIIALFIFWLQPENMLSKKIFNCLWLAAIFFIGIPESLSIGAQHTRDFWRDYYMSKGGNETDSYDFFGDTHISWLYYWGLMMFFGLYRALRENFEKKIKPEEDAGDGVSTIN